MVGTTTGKEGNVALESGAHDGPSNQPLTPNRMSASRIKAVCRLGVNHMADTQTQAFLNLG